MERILRAKRHFDLKYKYAFNQFGQPVFIDNANKNTNNEKWFFDDKQQHEMVLAAGNINIKHWRLKNVVVGTGSPGGLPESPEHHNAKMKIIIDKYIILDGYKIFIKKATIESYLFDSRYVSDIQAELLCGTNCVIEIIKTSQISESKRNYLNDNDLLTFEIFINDDGDQELCQFNFFGDKKIREIREKFVRGTRELESIGEQKLDSERIQGNIRAEVEGIKRSFRSSNNERHQRLAREKMFANKEIEREQNSYSRENYKRIKKGNSYIQKSRETTKEIISQIKKHRIGALKSRDQIREQREKIREFEEMEKEFREIAENCKAEWFGPKWIHPLKNVNTFNHIKYYCS